MKLTLFPVLIIFFLVACQQKSGNEKASKLIIGATIFDGNGNRIENGNILIENGKIKEIGNHEIIVDDKSTEVVDLKGKYIMPGLIDAHVHLTLSGFYDTRPEYVNLTKKFPYHQVLAQRKKMASIYLNTYLKSGITAVYDLGSESWTLDLQKNESHEFPHVAATGPLITHYKDPGIIDYVFINPKSPEDARLIARTLLSQGSNGIKCWRLDWENEEFINNIKALRDEVNKYGSHIIFHIETLQNLKDAIELGGKTIITHTPNDALFDRETITKIVESRTIHIPTLTVHSGYVRTLKGLLGENYQIENPNNVIDDYTWSMTKEMKQYSSSIDTTAVRKMLTFWEAIESDSNRNRKMQNLKLLYDAGALIAVGSDAGNPIIFHGPAIYDELEAMQNAGIKPIDLITMSTKNGAIAMGKEDSIGTLEIGKEADLLILKSDPSENISNIRLILRVMKKGEFIEIPAANTVYN